MKGRTEAEAYSTARGLLGSRSQERAEEEPAGSEAEENQKGLTSWMSVQATLIGLFLIDVGEWGK